MITQDGQTYITSHVPASTCLTDTKMCALKCTKAKIIKEKRSSKKPGIGFLCPPVLVDMLSHHWRDLQDGFSDPAELNMILVFQSDELRWTAQKRGFLPWAFRDGIDLTAIKPNSFSTPDWKISVLGLWSLEYKQELTSPLCIAAAQGFTDCLVYLLENGAHPDLSAGGKAAIHEACTYGNTECAELLLEHGANPNQLTEDGLAPLHLCRTPQSLRCAKALVRHGANADLPTEEEEDTPLLIAARHGLPHHVQLFLRYGANINHTSSSGETPLGAACSEAQQKPGEDEDEGHLQVCTILLRYGAMVNLADHERRTPLHKAARNVQIRLVQHLLDHGADINAIDYNGCSPLSNVLQNAILRQEYQPDILVQTLLNHGSIKVWPQALLKVLTACAAAPKAVEILFNSYTLVPVTYKWVEAIPEDIFKLHRSLYDSLFALEHKPRCLQHLCRSAVRKHFGKYCYLLIPKLPIPKMLQDYLLLRPEGYIN